MEGSGVANWTSKVRVRWQDWLCAAFGAWLLVSPQVMGYTLERAATGNARGVGAGVLVFNLIIAARFNDRGEDIFNILLGLWLTLSPVSLDFLDDKPVAANAILVGLALITLATSQIVRGEECRSNSRFASAELATLR